MSDLIDRTNNQSASVANSEGSASGVNEDSRVVTNQSKKESVTERALLTKLMIE